MAAKNAITKLTLREVSLVDDPDNAESTIDIIKARKASGETIREAFQTLANIAKAKADGEEPDEEAALAAANLIEETIMDMEKVQQALETAEENIAKVTEANTALTGQVETLTKALAEKDAEIVKLKAGAKADDKGDDEDIFKGMTPKAKEAFVALQKSNDATKLALETIQTQRETDEAIVKARSDGLPKPEETGPLMQRIAKGKTTEADAKAVTEMLKAAQAQLKKGTILKIVGSDQDVTGSESAEARLKGAAEEIRKANKGMTEAVAFTQAIDQHPDVYDEYLVEKRRRSAGAADGE